MGGGRKWDSRKVMSVSLPTFISVECTKEKREISRGAEAEAEQVGSCSRGLTDELIRDELL